jgi:chromosome segregation ATPase
MDRHRNVLAIDGWRETQIDLQSEKARLQDQLEQLNKTVDRLHALLPEYQELVKCARRNLQDAYGDQ